MEPLVQPKSSILTDQEDFVFSGSIFRNIFNESSTLDISEGNDLCRSSPLHWATMSDTILVSPSVLPVLNVIVCSGTETGNHHLPQHGQHLSTKQPPVRSKSVSNLIEEKLKHSDEEVIQMRNKLLILARNRALFQQLERNQKLTLALICVVYFFCFCAISVLAPFFHQIAVVHNISTSTYGLIFSIHPAVVFCTSPFIGHITPSIGPKFMFTSGVFLCGTCNLLFGTLEHVQDDLQFTILCFFVRGLGAVGASAFSTAGATYVANMFPDKISAIMGILETFIGLGFSIGPLIGGVFFTLGGFQLPFYVMGSAMLLTLPFSYKFLPKTDNTNPKRNLGTKVFVIFKIPAVFIICLVVAVSSSAWSVLEPTLVIHMQQFNLAPMQLGLLFLITSVSYAISSPFWGWLVGKYDHGNLMMVVGLSVTAISLLLLGPSPLLPGIPDVLWLNILALVLIGVFVALAYVPTYQALLQYAVQVGCETELSTYSVIAGLWASMYSLGEVLGPCVGSILVDVYDFPLAITVIGLLNLAVALMLLLYLTSSASRQKSPSCQNFSLPQPSDDQYENEPNGSDPIEIESDPIEIAASMCITSEREPLIFSRELTQTYGSTY